MTNLIFYNCDDDETREATRLPSASDHWGTQPHGIFPSIRKAAARIFIELCNDRDASDILDGEFIDEILSWAKPEDIMTGITLELFLKQYLKNEYDI